MPGDEGWRTLVGLPIAGTATPRSVPRSSESGVSIGRAVGGASAESAGEATIGSSVVAVFGCWISMAGVASLGELSSVPKSSSGSSWLAGSGASGVGLAAGSGTRAVGAGRVVLGRRGSGGGAAGIAPPPAAGNGTGPPGLEAVPGELVVRTGGASAGAGSGTAPERGSVSPEAVRGATGGAAPPGSSTFALSVLLSGFVAPPRETGKVVPHLGQRSCIPAAGMRDSSRLYCAAQFGQPSVMRAPRWSDCIRSAA